MFKRKGVNNGRPWSDRLGPRLTKRASVADAEATHVNLCFGVYGAVVKRLNPRHWSKIARETRKGGAYSPERSKGRSFSFAEGVRWARTMREQPRRIVPARA